MFEVTFRPESSSVDSFETICHFYIIWIGFFVGASLFSMRSTEQTVQLISRVQSIEKEFKQMLALLNLAPNDFSIIKR